VYEYSVQYLLLDRAVGVFDHEHGVVALGQHLVDGIQRIYGMVDGIQRIYGMVDGIQVHKVKRVSQRKPGNVWI
jgi:hypothetical protein